jgi:hypothetical protein
MTSATTHTIVGFFPTRERAEAAVDGLVREGFLRDQISIIASRDQRTTPTSAETPKIGPIDDIGSTSDTGEKAVIGGMAGFVIGIAALAIPGIGPVIAAGPLAMALTGAAAGAATGGLIGVLTNDGVPEEAARRYSKAIGAGHVMVSVRTDAGRVDQAAGILDQSGAIDVAEPAEKMASNRPIGTLTETDVRAARLDESSSLVARQRGRERRVDVYPGITGGGGSPNVSN